MSTFIGALLDVSGSMKNNIGDGIDEDGGTWARSIFHVMDDLVKHDISQHNYIFAAGFGAESGNNSIFDPLGTIQEVQKHHGINADIDQTIDESLTILERNGANKVRNWAEIYTIKAVVSATEAQLFLNRLRSDESFVQKFVEYLPSACKLGDQRLDPINISSSMRGSDFPFLGVYFAAYFAASALFSMATHPKETVIHSATSMGGLLRPATREDIEKVIANVRKVIDLKVVDNNSVFTVQEASDIIHGSVDEKDLTRKRARELLKMVEPYIYGKTPLYKTLRVASRMFLRSSNTYPNHHKLLFILSDGCPTDNGDIDSIKSQLTDAKVKIVGCYIRRSSAVSPRRLYNNHNVTDGWEKGATFLFNLSSTLPTQLVTRAIFVQQGWEIDISNNETKLFVHVNHPDHLKDACNLARNAVCCQDTLSDLLVSIDLDIYINQKNSSIKAHKQEGDTCYANASATVLHLAMQRVLGRDGGYPDFEALRDSMIQEHGIEGANTFRVLQAICPRYRLHCKEIDVNGAMEAITAKRPVVAKFRLAHGEWGSFRTFYQQNPTGILRKKDLDISQRTSNTTVTGHAVVLTSFNSECFRLMNSWGNHWADIGFFRVENAEVLGLEFIDVYWNESDLSQQERNYYGQHGSKVAEKLMKSLKALQLATFTCSGCRQPSNVTRFTGTLSQAKCPRCNHEFSSNDGDGNILALNIYLTSLSR